MKFETAMFKKRPFFRKYAKEIHHKEFLPFEKKQELQLAQLQELVNYHFNKNKWYKDKLLECGVRPIDIKKLSDIQSLPILNKDDYYEMRPFLPTPSRRTVKGMTGGSTGHPLKFFMSEKDYLYGVALLYRGWSYANYAYGDKVAIFAGYSLIGNDSNFYQTFRKKTYDWTLNFRHYSAMDMTNENLEKYIDDLRQWKPKFIRGYVSSIYVLANYIKHNHDKPGFVVEGIFTTSEKLLSSQKKIIEEVFNCPVYDHYGLNDGGLSAFECREHIGMHVDTERGILEVVDNEQSSNFQGEGNIIATSLYNYDYPFIRYNTNDSGHVIIKHCKCGIESQVITKIFGRQTDFLELNKVKVGGPVLTTIWNDVDVLQYQFEQVGENELIIRIVKGALFSYDNEMVLRNRMYDHFGNITLDIRYVDSIHVKDGNKHKFIIKSF